jgi:hypothetical protein
LLGGGDRGGKVKRMESNESRGGLQGSSLFDMDGAPPSAPSPPPAAVRRWARAGDPESSQAAAADVLAHFAGEQERRTLEALRANPGATSAELAVVLAVDRHQPARVLPRLRAAKLVRSDGYKVCTACRRLCLQWFPVETATPAGEGGGA